MRTAQQRRVDAGSTQVLELIDTFALKWIEAAQPTQFRTASARELDAVFRLRYRTIVEEGWASPRDFPDGRERDDYDDDAIHIVGVEGANLLGTSRLVLPAPGRPLPTEATFELTAQIPTGLVDLGRMVVTPDYRDRSHRIFAGLLGRSWLEGRSRDFSGILGNASASVIERYEELGIRLTVLGPARRSWGQQRWPICLDAGATAASFLRNRVAR